MSNGSAAFGRFVEVVRKLRDPDRGCPWDLEQDHRSLRPYLIEESYEVLEAIDSGDDAELTKELGDLLLQVVLHAQVAADRKAFTITEVVESVTEKMIRRHPHVFGDVQVSGSSEVLKNWERIKSEERTGDKQSATSSLSGIPKALPALIRAERLGEKAAKVSFDWRSAKDVWGKVEEELGELARELHVGGSFAEKPVGGQRDRIAEEVGDLLFSLCQLSRWLGFHAEDALREASDRFLARFVTMEGMIDRPLRELSDEEMEDAWQRAKAVTK